MELFKAETTSRMSERARVSPSEPRTWRHAFSRSGHSERNAGAYYVWYVEVLREAETQPGQDQPWRATVGRVKRMAPPTSC
jgi:hypothetical protein